jgi:hypothetical protein
VRLVERGSGEQVRAARVGADVVGGRSAAGLGRWVHAGDAIGRMIACARGGPLHFGGPVDPPCWRIWFPGPSGRTAHVGRHVLFWCHPMSFLAELGMLDYQPIDGHGRRIFQSVHTGDSAQMDVGVHIKRNRYSHWRNTGSPGGIGRVYVGSQESLRGSCRSCGLARPYGWEV